MRDEDVNPMMGTNMRIAEILGKKYGSDNPESLYVLLSDPAFERDVNELREKFGIKRVNKKTSDGTAQQYIADCVAARSGRTVRGLADFELFYGEFYAAFLSIRKKHKVPKLPIDLIDQYIIKGEAFLSQQYAPNHIKVSMNKNTKELTIRLSPETKKRDLQDVLSVIYESWNEHRTAPSKRKPSTAANVHSQMARYAAGHTEKETAEKFGQSEENVHKIKMRAKKRRNKLIQNNDKE
jgi:hypothetical protein